jgi:hypothetical protein
MNGYAVVENRLNSRQLHWINEDHCFFIASHFLASVSLITSADVCLLRFVGASIDFCRGIY